MSDNGPAKMPLVAPGRRGLSGDRVTDMGVSV